jgi:16S rRNA C1402 (ribose-2'-O) methylase RsmI
MRLYKENYDTERLSHVVVDIDAILLERTRVSNKLIKASAYYKAACFDTFRLQNE